MSRPNDNDDGNDDSAAATTVLLLDDDPCWGSPTSCSLSDLLKRLDTTGGRSDQQQRQQQQTAMAKPSLSSVLLYETDDYLAINKPPDLRMDGPYAATVHKLLTYWYPAPSLLLDVAGSKQKERNTDNNDNVLLLDRVKRLHKYNMIADNELRPCHQLDYATSGVLLVARNKRAADTARHAFEHRHVKKAYLAIVEGDVMATVDQMIGNDNNNNSNVSIDEKELDRRIEAMELQYRRTRRKRRTDTFVGYQPPHALFQRWQQQQKLQQQMQKESRKRQLDGDGEVNEEGARAQVNDDDSNVAQKKTKQQKKNKSNVQLSQEEWDQVWEGVEAILTPSLHASLITTRWKDISSINMDDDGAATTTVSIKQQFKRAADIYNRLCRDKIEKQQHQQEKGNNNANGNADMGLPVVFRVLGNDSDDDCGHNNNKNTFFVCASLAQVQDEFPMRVHPDVVTGLSSLRKTDDGDDRVLTGSVVPVGDLGSMDYKPSLTKCTVLKTLRWRQEGGGAAAGQQQQLLVSKVLLEPRTGRRHQLRVHTALLGHPIVGDQTYQTQTSSTTSSTTTRTKKNKKKSTIINSPRMCLHSYSLEIEKSPVSKASSSSTPPSVPPLRVQAKDPFIESDDGRELLDVALF